MNITGFFIFTSVSGAFLFVFPIFFFFYIFYYFPLISTYTSVQNFH